MTEKVSLPSRVDQVLVLSGWVCNWADSPWGMRKLMARRGVFWIQIYEYTENWKAVFYTAEKHADDNWKDTGATNEEEILIAVTEWNQEVNIFLTHAL